MQDFKPITKTSVSSAIVSQILEMINAGKLNPGDRIPTELQLCEMFCVGRGSVREGIKILETMGVLERRGKAVVVQDAASFNAASFTSMSRAVENINHVIEARNIIEVDACRLAAMRATPEDIQKLWSITQQSISDYEAFSTCDRSFHRAVIEASHNPVLLQIYDLICDILFQTEDVYSPESFSVDQQSIVQESIRLHQDIIHAIERKDYKQAIIKMKDHLERAGNHLIKSIRSRNDSSSHSDQ